MFNLFKKKQDDSTDLDAAIKCMQKGQLDEALRRADVIIEFGPDIALSHRFKGEVLFEMGRQTECRESFAKAEEVGGPGTEELFFWRALSHANEGHKDEAISILRGYIDSPDAAPGMVAKCESAITTIGG